jgi:hypothetical protein
MEKLTCVNAVSEIRYLYLGAEYGVQRLSLCEHKKLNDQARIR